MPNSDWNCSGCGLEYLSSSKVDISKEFIIPYLICEPHFSLFSRDCCISFGENNDLSCFVDSSEVEQQVDAVNLIRVHDVRTIGNRVWVTLRNSRLNIFLEYLISSANMCYRFIKE